jgi:two-component system, OmpR family, sensor histidine kinase BaeS
MPTDRPYGWGRHPRRRGRPRWWPENEAWPPEGPEGWRRMRRRFMWRAGLFFLLVLVVVALVISFLVDLITSFLGGRQPFLVSALLLVIILVVAASGLRRLVRGTAVPVGDLVEAAGRLQAGEIGTQVDERGPSEVRALAHAFNAMSARLAATDAQRRRLLSDVSHELRTPLTVIQGNLEAIIDGIYPADDAHLAPILEEARVLGRLVDDLRTLASAEAGALSLEREPVDLGHLVADLVAGFHPQADAAGVTLSVEAPEPVTADADPERLRQVLANLVANALRATPRGGRISIEVARDAAGAPVLTVADTGAGMEPDELERIFERFYRSAASRGSGLGLPIAREIVRAHGGRIEATSAPGAGTTMRVHLPPSA